MASPVDYNPIPQVTPSGQGLPSLQVNTPREAFGAGIANAITDLGNVTQRAGAELYDRAVAMQTINEQANATEASARATEQMGAREADYRTQLGKNAIDGYKPYVEDMGKIYDENRGALSSPVAQRYYDSQTRMIKARAIMTASTHLGVESKNYVAGASQAKIDAAVNQALMSPDDEEGFNNGLKTVEEESKHLAMIKGLSPEATQELIDTNTAGVRFSRLMGMAKTPEGSFAAEKLLEQWTKTGVVEKSASEQVGKPVGPEDTDQGPKRQIMIKPGVNLGDMDPSAKGMLEGIARAGIQVNVTAGYAKSGHVQTSQHYVGKAVDFDVTGWSNEQKAALIQAGIANGARGIGIYPSGNSIHMDTRDTPAFWGPRGGSPSKGYPGSGIDEAPAWAKEALTPLFQSAGRSGGLLRGEQAVKAQEYIKQKQYTIGARSQASQTFNGQNTLLGDTVTDTNTIREGIAAIESDGRWIGAHPPAPNGDHAVGRYGIMSRNLPSWLKAAGLDPTMTEQEFIDNHQAQDQVANYWIDYYRKKYNGNANLVAAAWQGGEGAVQKYLAGRAGGLSDGNLTVPEYIQKFNRALGRNASADDYQRVADKQGEQMVPGDLQFRDALQQQMEILHSRQERIERENDQNNKQTIYDAINDGLADGKLPTSVDELTTTPEREEAWDALTPRDQNMFLKALAANAKGDYRWTPEGEREYQKLIGTAMDPGLSKEDTEKFLNTDVVGLKIPWSARQELMKRQSQIMKNATASPRMGHALQLLAPTLEAKGWTRQEDPDSYHMFVGALHAAMQEQMDSDKAPLSDDDIEDVAAKIMQEVSWQENGWFGKTTKTGPAFMAAIDDASRQKIVERYKAVNGGAEPSDQRIHEIWIANQYRLNLSKPSATKPTTPTGPQVPMSK